MTWWMVFESLLVTFAVWAELVEEPEDEKQMKECVL